MFISKKYIPRRSFLHGAGATLALPLLESMLPAQTPLRNTAANPPDRFMAVFYPHGAAPGWWEPAVEGPLPKVFPDDPSGHSMFIMKPLEPFRDQTVIMTGLWSESAEPPEGMTGSDHLVAAAFLSGVKPKKTAGPDVSVGNATIDQLIARKIGQDTLLPSLELAVEDPGANSGSCGEGYSCAYTNCIAWSAANRPIPMEINPQIVFDRMFGSGGTPGQRVARRKESQSILDWVTEELSGLKQKIGPNDRRTIDQYTEEVREIERRLQLAAKASSATPETKEPFGIPSEFDAHIKLHLDLVALAFRADITRVATLQGARDLSQRTYRVLDGSVSRGFHGLSHHQDDVRQMAEYAKINQYHIYTMTYLLEKLRAIPEGDGTLLDHSLTLWGSNMGNSNQHQHFDVPHVLVGGANGQLKGGRHLAYPKKTQPTGNLLSSILDMYGFHSDNQDDNRKRLPNL